MNRVIEKPEGFYAVVDGREFGPWMMKEYAKAGLQVEERRATKRAKQAG